MTATELLAELSTLGVEVRRRGDKLQVKGPRGAVTHDLLDTLSRLKPAVLRILRWDPLVPAGWTPEAWHGRLSYMAKICDYPDRAEELRDRAAAVADRYGLDPRSGGCR